jgi:hypothetical protein
MLGLKSFRTAAVVIGGIELAEKIKKKDNLRSASLAAPRRRCRKSGKLPSLRRGDPFKLQINIGQLRCLPEFTPEPS